MKNIISIALLSILSTVISSCNTTEENQAPVVTIISPKASNNPFMSGNSVNIHIEFTDDDELHEMSIEVVREHDGAIVYESHPHQHATAFTFNIDTVLTTAMHSDFTITAIGTDHDDLITTVTETIHMHPM